MKKLLLAGVAFAALVAGPATAADLGRPVYKAPPPVYAPVPSWTGFYIGLNAGYTFSNRNSADTSAANIQFCGAGCSGGLAGANAAAAGATAALGVKNNGFIGGGQIGYNYQVASSWVAGIEADFQGARARGSASAASNVGLVGFPANSVGTVVSVDKRLDFLGTVRGRLGFLVTPALLVYGTGGLAYGHATTTATYSQQLSGPSAGIATAWSGASNGSNSRVGWTIGGGGEWMLPLSNWSAKIEYLYYDLGTVTTNTLLVDGFLGGVVVPGAPAFFTNVASSTTRFNGSIVRAGINYKFGYADAPAVYR